MRRAATLSKISFPFALIRVVDGVPACPTVALRSNPSVAASYRYVTARNDEHPKEVKAACYNPRWGGYLAHRD